MSERASDRILGQKAAALLLRRFLLSSRKNTTLLFHGPRSSGKRTAARLLACDLLEDKKPLRNVHPDYVEISRKDVADIDKIREWRKAASKLPFESKRVVMSLISVENMSLGSANSLLKLLEEPPEHVTIILTSDNLSRVLDTIQSRSMKIPFVELTVDTKAEILRQKKVKQDIIQRIVFSKTLGEAIHSENYRERLEKFNRAKLTVSAVVNGDALALVNAAEQSDPAVLAEYLASTSDDPRVVAAAVEGVQMAKVGVKPFQINCHILRPLRRA